MNEKDLRDGFVQLGELSKGDYHQPIEEVLSDSDGRVVFTRLGRLMGVTLKQPFAVATSLPRPSDHTGSYRGWELDPNAFSSPQVRRTWQYRTLEAILREDPNDRRFASVEELAQDAHYERGFFGYLGRSACKYICGDSKMRKEIDKRVTAAKKAGFTTSHLTPEILVQAGGLSLGVFLVAHVPILAVVGAPVIAGFVLVLYSIGADAFCKYMDDYYSGKET